MSLHSPFPKKYLYEIFNILDTPKKSICSLAIGSSHATESWSTYPGCLCEPSFVRSVLLLYLHPAFCLFPCLQRGMHSPITRAPSLPASLLSQAGSEQEPKGLSVWLVSIQCPWLIKYVPRKERCRCPSPRCCCW